MGDARKKNWHQKSIKICLKLPTEKKYSPKMHKTKIGPESHSLKKATSKRPAKSFWIEKIEKKKKMGNFSTRIMKNAAEMKSISQNSNKIIQKKSNFSQFVPSKNHWPPPPNCASWFFVNPAAWISAVCFYIILWFQKILWKKNGIKKFSTKTLHVIALWRSVLFSMIT